MIIPEHKISFIGVTKSASTSVECYLASRFRDMPENHHWRKHEGIQATCLLGDLGANSAQHFPASKHVAYIKNVLKEDPNDWYFLSVPRDPIERLFSEYKYMQRRKPKAYRGSFSECIQRRALWECGHAWHGMTYTSMVEGCPNLTQINMHALGTELPKWVDKVTGTTSDLKLHAMNTTDNLDTPYLSQSDIDIIDSYWWEDTGRDYRDVWLPISPKMEGFVKANIASDLGTGSMEMLRLIILSRRGKWGDSWDKFSKILDTNIDAIYATESWRWITSICETVVERCPDKSIANAFNIITVATLFEKIHSKYNNNINLDLNARNPDVTINLFKRLGFKEGSVELKLIHSAFNALNKTPDTLTGKYIDLLGNKKTLLIGEDK